MSLQRIRVAAGVVFALALAVSASAQTGTLRGKVVDAKGQPVADAKVTIEFKGNITRKAETKTNRQGQYVQVGLASGSYDVTVEKDDLKATQNTRVTLGDPVELNFALVPGGGGGSPEDAKALEAKRKELEGKYMAAVALIDAGKPDEGIAQLNAVIAETGGCAICEAKIGEALWKKGDEAGAEAQFKKAITVDAKLADSYAALASLYNKQQKFEQAAEMSKKATELAGTGGAGAGASASVVYNQGIIFWNQSKVAEAKAQFEQAIKLDPNMADAHYWFGMALVNEGALPDAVKSFEKYVSLAPKGQYAEQAQAMLKAIKK